MKLRIFILGSLSKFVLSFFVLALCLPGLAGPKPNIIVIVADDLGWADLGVQGATDVLTPNINALATNGVRFTSGYVTAPVCSPSRAGLLTGRYQQRFGHETNPGTPLERDPHFGLPLTETTMADRLKSLGYTTGWIGKSHLGGDTNLFHPLKRGFDEFFGFVESHHHYFNLPGNYTNDVDPILRGYTPVDETNYLTDAFARECVRFITNHAAEPFFLYAPFNATHFWLEAPQALLDRFDTNDFSGNMNRYTNVAMLAGLDDAVSNIVKTLSSLNIETNTLIFFTSDNGGATDFGSVNIPLRGAKADLYEGGIRVPFIMQWKGSLPTNTVRDGIVSTLDILPTAIAAADGMISDWWQLDGMNLLPYASGQTAGSPHTNLFWRIETNGSLDDDVKDGIRAVRSGDWKLVKQGIRASWELYNLAADIGETNNLADARPEILQQLVAAYNTWNAQLASGLWARNDLNYQPPDLAREDVRLGATNVSYVSPEFLPGGTQFTFQDASSNLWVGDLDPLTGFLVSPDGRDLHIDSNLPPSGNGMSGAQWGLSTNNPALFYTKVTGSGRRQLFRMRTVAGNLVTNQLTAGATNESFSVRASQETSNASVKLVFNFGTTNSSTRIWGDEFALASSAAVPSPAPGFDNGSWIPGSADLAFSGYSLTSTSQVMRLNTSNGLATAISGDAGEKSDVCAFLAPELNGELLYATVIGHTNIAFYRDTHATNGLFTRLLTLSLPAGATSAYFYSLRPLVGGRGYNGVSYFTCVVQQNNSATNPGNSAIYLLGLGADLSQPIVRRLDEGDLTTLLADRRDPKTFIGTREVFSYFSLYDGPNPVQLRVAHTGIKSPDHTGAASGFTQLKFSRSFIPGNSDGSSNTMNLTEIMNFATHGGKLFAGTGSKGFFPYPTVSEVTNLAPATNWSGAWVLVKDSPTSEWRVDDAFTNDLFRVHLRVETLTEISLTTDVNSNAFAATTNFLVCGLADITAFGSLAASARLRDDATGRWSDSHVASTDEAANTISFGAHITQLGTNRPVHNIFAGLSNGEIHRGGYDPAVTNFTWVQKAEFTNGGSITSFAECGGKIYAASGLAQTSSNTVIGGGLYVRNDATRTWSLVYRWPSPFGVYALTNEDLLLRGLTAAPGPRGDDIQILLAARAWPGVIERIETENTNAVVVELDVRDFYARLWNDDRVRNASVTIAYSGFTAVTNPVTGELTHLIGVWIENPDVNAASHNGSHFLIRHRDATYESADILNDGYNANLRATRCIAPSPFAGEQNSFYFGGYDAANDSVTNTAWIMRGDWTVWPSLAISRSVPREALISWPFTDASWQLESSSVLGAGASWQPVSGLPTRATRGSIQGVNAQSGNEYFRLRRP